MSHQTQLDRPRSGWVLLAAALVLAIASVTTLLLATLTRAERPAPAATPAATIPPEPRPPGTLAPGTPAQPLPLPITSAPPTQRPPAPPPNPLAGPVGDEVLSAELRAQRPTDLDPVTEASVLAVASRALIADLTGAGREAFPDYLPGEPPARLHTAVRVQAAVARAVPGRGLVEVRLLWAGITPNGQAVERQSAQLHLRYGDRAWQPIAATP